MQKEYYIYGRTMPGTSQHYLQTIHGTLATEAIQVVLNYPDGDIIEFPIIWNKYSETDLSPVVKLYADTLVALDDDLINLLKDFSANLKANKNVTPEDWEQILKAHGFVEAH